MRLPTPRMVLALLVAAATGCATTYQARGLVVKVDPATSELTVSHDAIPGYMEAMVMPLVVRDPALMTGIEPGDVISFRLRPDSRGTTIDRLAYLSAAGADVGLTTTPAVAALAKIGEIVPDFTLTDQHGASVSLAQLRGRVVVVTFIYTRCPLPDYCPRIVTNLTQIRRRYPERMDRDLTLLTVTFDPKYDSQEVLKSFAAKYEGNVPGWHFLTGSPEATAAVCASFGIEYWLDQGLITHSLQTAIIDREGRLRARVEGRGFTGRQISDLVGAILE